jgi:hypothetical protein
MRRVAEHAIASAEAKAHKSRKTGNGGSFKKLAILRLNQITLLL